MACGSNYYEDNPVREAQRQALVAKKNETAAAKIAEFFVNAVGASRVELAPGGEHTKVTRILLSKGERLLVQHRGYKICVVASEVYQGALVLAFNEWRAQHMSHARIVP